MQDLYEVTGIFGNFKRNTTRVFSADSPEGALKKAEEGGFKFPLNFIEELKAKEKGAAFPEKKVGLVYEIKLLKTIK